MYEGDWVNDKRHARGLFVDTFRECTYEGDYVEENQIGQCEVTFNHSGFYKGDFVDGFKQDHSILRYSDGSCYEGYWNNNAECSKGVYVGQCRDKYDGKWLDYLKRGK